MVPGNGSAKVILFGITVFFHKILFKLLSINSDTLAILLRSYLLSFPTFNCTSNSHFGSSKKESEKREKISN